MQIRRGEIHGLCGENGAGKSTLMKILSGVYPYGTYEGSIIYEGKELNLGAGAIRQARDEGIAIVYQELTLVPNMTVGENVFLGKEPSAKGSIDWSELYANTRDILAKYRLDVSPQAAVKHLGVGKMQMVEIAKALSENAKILILDEPTSALTESEIDKLMEILENLRGHGVTCIYITHKLEEFFRITDSVTILRDGKTVTTQPTRQLTQEKLVSYMVGREMKERFPRGHRQPREVIFEVAGLQAVDPNETSRTVLDGVTFNLRRGEILGIAGLMGSGRTELVTTIFGEYGKITGGVIKLEGKEVHISDARDAMHKGISLVPEDRKGQGLVLMQSILKNISLANLDQFSTFFRIDADAEMVAATQQAKSLGVKAPNLQAQVDSLSGGNQQKVVIAKWLLSNPKILIMDDPTRGIDVGAKYEIYKLMNDLAERGVAIIMISSELEEVLGMSDRIMVMHEGRSTLTLDIAEASQERIMALATGIADEILPV
ncbi:MAG: ATP-binding cassette domain-containing protein [Caldilineaceae bacterium]|jgi:D-xylose transport system ATP-binding protein|nr:ATP-binding cassette domain-containing protein [Caldilineaceae bacterium]